MFNYNPLFVYVNISDSEVDCFTLQGNQDGESLAIQVHFQHKQNWLHLQQSLETTLLLPLHESQGISLILRLSPFGVSPHFDGNNFRWLHSYEKTYLNVEGTRFN